SGVTFAGGTPGPAGQAASTLGRLGFWARGAVVTGRTRWDGEEYQRRFDDLARMGANVHGEVDLLMTRRPRSVLDAGCGTGRVAIELARRGLEVVGTDREASMIATARRRAPEVIWVVADLAELDLGRSFDLVVMAGNVLLFTEPGTEAGV